MMRTTFSSGVINGGVTYRAVQIITSSVWSVMNRFSVTEAVGIAREAKQGWAHNHNH